MGGWCCGLAGGNIHPYLYTHTDIHTRINCQLMWTGYSQQTEEKNKQLIRAFGIIVIYTVHHLQVLQK